MNKKFCPPSCPFIKNKEKCEFVCEDKDFGLNAGDDVCIYSKSAVVQDEFDQQEKSDSELHYPCN